MTVEDRHSACTQCGYDLRGLGGDGRCPECGLLIAVSESRPKDFKARQRFEIFTIAYACAVIGCGLAAAWVGSLFPATTYRAWAPHLAPARRLAWTNAGVAAALCVIGCALLVIGPTRSRKGWIFFWLGVSVVVAMWSLPPS